MNRPRLVAFLLVATLLVAAQGGAAAETVTLDPDGTTGTDTGPNSDE